MGVPTRVWLRRLGVFGGIGAGKRSQHISCLFLATDESAPANLGLNMCLLCSLVEIICKYGAQELVEEDELIGCNW